MRAGIWGGGGRTGKRKITGWLGSVSVACPTEAPIRGKAMRTYTSLYSTCYRESQHRTREGHEDVIQDNRVNRLLMNVNASNGVAA